MLQGGLSLQHSSALQLARLHPMLHENLSTLFGPAAQPGNNVNGHMKNEMKTTLLKKV